MSTAVPVLDITTAPLTKRMVRIDGKTYALRTRSALALGAPAKHGPVFVHLGALLKIKQPTAAQRKTRTRLLNQATRLVLEAPTKVHAKLRESHQLAIVTAFAEQSR